MTAPSFDEPFVLLEGGFCSGGAELYRDPLWMISANSQDEVGPALAEIDAAAARGRAVAGMLSYELGYALEPRLRPLMPKRRDLPLLWMGIFEQPERPIARSPAPATAPAGLAPSAAEAAYRAGVERIKAYIRAGDVYQVNYTHALAGEHKADACALYEALKANQPVPYPAALCFDQTKVLSLSPELFFRIDAGRITARPMKGTAPRERSLPDDRRAARALQDDEKNRAENLMIVDLMRNDISKIARTGSVRVPALFTVETYRTLHTLTSTIEAELKPNVPPSEIIKALFPCGSVTGAPKIRAMEIIRELEAHPRGVYTGAIGIFRPDGSAVFNVAIRTLTLTGKRVSIGVGGAIVADSKTPSEAAETRLKAQFLTGLPARPADQAPLQLIETMRWTPQGGFALFDEHMERLRDSAAYFGFPLDLERICSLLAELARTYALPMRVRLTVDESGRPEISDSPLAADKHIWRFVISDSRIRSGDPYRAHKTTRRALYDEEHARLSLGTGCDEVLYLNERGELAEGARTNLFIARDGVLLTPPLSSGALPGTLRRSLLEQGRAREAVLTLADLDAAGEIYLGNSVRGLVRAMRITEPATREVNHKGHEGSTKDTETAPPDVLKLGTL